MIRGLLWRLGALPGEVNTIIFFLLDCLTNFTHMLPPKMIPKSVQNLATNQSKNQYNCSSTFSLILQRILLNFLMPFSSNFSTCQKCRDPRFTRVFSSGSRVAPSEILANYNLKSIEQTIKKILRF